MKFKNCIYFLVIILLVSIISSSFSAYAVTKVTVDDFTYVVKSNGEYSVCGYSGTNADVKVPQSINGHTITEVYESAFENNSTLKYISLPVTVTAIGDYAFAGCTSLEEFELTADISTVGQYAFKGCTVLSNVNSYFWQGEKIANGTFSGCTSLTDFYIPGTVKSIGAFAFINSGLTSLELPNNVTVVGDSAFKNCADLKNVTFGTGLTTINAYCFQNSGLTDLSLPDNIITISTYAFSDCVDLATAFVPSSVESIEYMAFDGCDNLTVTGYTGSTAESYCIDNGIEFKDVTYQPTIDTSGYQKADVNLDGYINIMDVTALQRHLAHLDILSELSLQLADANGDFAINIRDATYIQLMILELV